MPSAEFNLKHFLYTTKETVDRKINVLCFKSGQKKDYLSAQELHEGLYSALEKLGPRKKVLAVPPDITRFHSQAGEITNLIWKYYGDKLTDILPAVGTHYPMTDKEIAVMFSDAPRQLFRRHNFRGDLATLAGFLLSMSKKLARDC